MKKLKNKLNERYQNSDELFKLITKYNLNEIISNAIESIDSKMTDNELKELPRLSGMILNDINSIISTIKVTEHKRKIEYLLSDIFQEYIEALLKEDNSNQVIEEIIENLKIACEYRGYNYNALNQILGLEKNTLLKPKRKIKEIYYGWLGKNEELDEICRDLYDKKIIYSVKEFKKLFKPISETFYVRFNPIYKDEIIILFWTLKKLKLITPKGISGYFSPFVHYAMDNENNFLIQKTINKEHERIKRNTSKHIAIKEKMESIVLLNLKNKRQ